MDRVVVVCYNDTQTVVTNRWMVSMVWYICVLACFGEPVAPVVDVPKNAEQTMQDSSPELPTEPISFPIQLSFSMQLALAGEKLENPSIRYDPAYVSIAYPNGDVSQDTGVCTDVIIRAYRRFGVDLQKEIHEDIVRNPKRYPNIRKADTNIDHRRVPNLLAYFAAHGEKLPISHNASDYQPGDIVAWKLGGPSGLNHIGLVTSRKSSDGERYLMVHNVGYGQVVEDFLFEEHIFAHYRYIPAHYVQDAQ